MAGSPLAALSSTASENLQTQIMPPESRRLSLCPLPLWERAARSFRGKGWVRGPAATPHPIAPVARSALPSPTRGEGAYASAEFPDAVRLEHFPAKCAAVRRRKCDKCKNPAVRPTVSIRRRLPAIGDTPASFPQWRPHTNDRPLSSASPMRAQLVAVSAIRILLVGVPRLILAPQDEHGMESLRTSTVTSFSVCCPHFWQRILRMVRSAVENFIVVGPNLLPRQARIGVAGRGHAA